MLGAYPEITSNNSPFYILDTRNLTWVTQFEPETTFEPETAALTTAEIIGIVLGAVGLVAIVIIAGLLGYRSYKKRRIYRPKRAKHCMSYN